MSRPTAKRPAGAREEARVPLRTAAVRTKPTGIGVATQFAMATALTLAASMIVFGFVLYSQISEVLSEEIDAQGVAAARALAITDVECWKPFHGTALAGEESQATVNLPTDPHQLETFTRRRDANLGRVTRLANAEGTKILDAFITDVKRGTVLNGRNEILFAGEGSTRMLGDVQVRAGQYRAGSRNTRARLYTAPISSAIGAIAGYASVAISAEKIDDTLSDLTTRLTELTVLFIALGTVGAIFVAKRVTRPISLLSEDIEAVASGDLTHRTPAHSSDEIGVLARTFDRMTQNLQGMKELERNQAAQQHQLAVAREVQAALLPEELPSVPGFELAAASRPARNISVDSYDVAETAGGATVLVVLSASGAGVPGAMVVTMARSLIKAVAPHEISPAELLRKANRLLAPDLRRGMYVSALIVRTDPAGGRVVVANAGHHPLLLCRKGARSAEPVHSDGIALGFDKGPVFDRTIKDREVEVGPGDRLLLCTRSLFATRNAEGAAIGEARVYALFAKFSGQSSGDFVETTLNALEAYSEGAETKEDLTFLTVRRTGP
jgi:serine phosphatase RsbU (regulator of sigma subunit)